MPRRFDFFEDFGDFSVSPDEIGRSDDAHRLFSVKFFELPSTVFLQNLFVRIGKKKDSEPVFFLEFAVRFDRIGTDPDYHCVLFLELVGKFSELLCRCRAAGCVVARIEVKNDVITREI